MHNRLITAVFALFLLSGCTSGPSSSDPATLRQQVMDAERGFADSMAKRDFVAFQSFLADDTVFFAGPKPLRGKQIVAADWKKYYDEAKPPFSWEPKEVEVLDSGTLAISSGPVRDPDGKVFATFTSIWQLQDGTWKIIFDKGSRYCN